MTQHEREEAIGKLVSDIQETERDLVFLERQAEEFARSFQIIATFMRNAADPAANFSVKAEKAPQASDFLQPETVAKALELARRIEKARIELRRLHAQKDAAHL